MELSNCGVVLRYFLGSSLGSFMPARTKSRESVLASGSRRPNTRCECEDSLTAKLTLPDAERNNWLSSGRQETGLKVQILFAPPSSFSGFEHLGESIEI